jgi:hypothetical protein
MTKKDFDEFLLIKEKEQKDIPEIDWEAEKDEWLLYLDKLYELFENFLNDYVKKGKIKIAYDEISLTEEYIGNYKAKRMTIEFAGEKITLKPVGTNLIGVKGRVDMIGKFSSAKIVLVDSRMKGIRDRIFERETQKKDKKHQEETIIWEWRFVTAPPTRLYQPINEDTIYSVIMELSNG